MYTLEAITKLQTNGFKFQKREVEKGEGHGAPDTNADLYKKGKQEVRLYFWTGSDFVSRCQVIPESTLGENNFPHNS